MKKLLLFLAAVFCLQLRAQTTIAGGAVYGTWTLAGSPYIIQSSVVVPNDSTLTIQPGVVVDFQGHYKILALGRILAVGSQTDSIYFTTTNTTTGWYGIRFDNTTSNNDTSRFFYCSMSYGVANGLSGNDPNGGAFMFKNFSKAVVSNCLLKNNSVYAIYCTGASPVIVNNNILNNVGGGILNNSSPYIAGNNISYNSGAGVSGGTTLTIYNNVISHNSGVGIFAGNGTISYNTISYNSDSYWAGGIYLDDQVLNNVSHNIISYNTMTGGGYGGGITARLNNSIITDNIIVNNSSPTGGGIFIIAVGGANPTVSNNLIANNTASGTGGEGGGILCEGDTAALVNNTIVNNTAANGGGVYCNGVSTLSFYNCILYGNTASADGAQVYIYDQSSTPNFYYCDVEGGTAAFGLNSNVYLGNYTSNINIDPKFVSPSAGSGITFNGATANWSLQSVSPCINTGRPIGTYPAADLAGNPRVYNSIIDMGAYEFQGSQGGISNNNFQNQIVIYPNPAQNNFTIETNSTEKQMIFVFDVNGKLVLNQFIHGKTTVDVSNLNAGVYSVNITSNEGTQTKKLVVVK